MRTKTTLGGGETTSKSTRVEENTQKKELSPGIWCFVSNQRSPCFLSQAAPLSVKHPESPYEYTSDDIYRDHISNQFLIPFQRKG